MLRLDAQRLQVVSNGIGSLLTESKIVFLGAAVIAVSLDHDWLGDALDAFCRCLQLLGQLRRKVGVIEVEEECVHEDAVGCFIQKASTLVNLRLCSCVDADRIGASTRLAVLTAVARGAERTQVGRCKGIGVLANIRLADEPVSAVAVFTANFASRLLGWRFAASLEAGVAVARLRNTLRVLDTLLASSVEADIGLTFDLAIGVIVAVRVVRLTGG